MRLLQISNQKRVAASRQLVKRKRQLSKPKSIKQQRRVKPASIIIEIIKLAMKTNAAMIIERPRESENQANKIICAASW